MSQRIKCPACNSMLLLAVIDYETFHIDLYCGVCGGFVGHFDTITAEFFQKLQKFVGPKEEIPEELDLEDEVDQNTKTEGTV